MIRNPILPLMMLYIVQIKRCTRISVHVKKMVPSDKTIALDTFPRTFNIDADDCPVTRIAESIARRHSICGDWIKPGRIPRLYLALVQHHSFLYNNGVLCKEFPVANISKESRK